MEHTYTVLTKENIACQHLCCAIADKKMQAGVEAKKQWLCGRFAAGHTFYKLDERGKVFIEYTPIENALASVEGKEYLYIHCLWVSGKFAKSGHGKALLQHCIDDAKRQGKQGVCAIAGQKKMPFLSDKKFLQHFGFEVVDSLPGGYELLALPFGKGAPPRFTDAARHMETVPPEKGLVIYHSAQCPLIDFCLSDVEVYCEKHSIHCQLRPVTTPQAARQVPGPFNNWALFWNGKFETVHLMNQGYLEKLLKNKTEE